MFRISKGLFMHFVKDKIHILIIAIGSILWSLTMVKSGLIYPFGMGFWGPNGHDGIWHLALINHFAKGDFGMPVYAGEQLRNYHIGFDFLLSIIQRVTQIPAQNLYFQVLPPILSILVGILTWKLVLGWGKSKIQALCVLFFVYFGGSFGWIVTLFRGEGISGESMFWSQQAISTLINPPFAASLVLMLAGMYLLVKLDKNFNIFYFLFTILVFGVLSQVKVYAGILALFGLFVIGFVRIIKNKRVDFLALFVGSAILSAVLFLPSNKGSSNMLIFRPFWFLETMMAVSDRFGWNKFYEAMINWRAAGIWPKAVLAYSVAFAIFLLGNMGTRILGIFVLVRSKKEKRADNISLFLVSIAILGIILPMFVLQKGTPWNTIQFFYYSLFTLSIFAGITCGQWIGEWIKTGRIHKVVICTTIIVVLTVPTTFSTVFYHYLPGRPPAKISNAELEALSYLKKQPNGIILTYPFDRKAAEVAQLNPPRPLYLYESTAYVSAFSAKSVYLEDEVNLDITGYDWKTRRQEVLDFLASLDHQKTRDFLRVNDIKYVYWIKPQRATLGEGQLGMTQIFENKEVIIYKVD